MCEEEHAALIVVCEVGWMAAKIRICSVRASCRLTTWLPTETVRRRLSRFLQAASLATPQKRPLVFIHFPSGNKFTKRSSVLRCDQVGSSGQRGEIDEPL